MTCPYCGGPLTRKGADRWDPEGFAFCPRHGVLDDVDLRPHLYPQRNPAMPTTDRQMLTISEAARRLGVAPKTVRKLIDSGHLPTIQPERRRYILAADLERFTSGGQR